MAIGGPVNIGVPGLKRYTVTVDPGNLASDAIANTDVVVNPGPDVGDLVIGFNPPAALEAGLVVQSVRVSAAQTFRFRIQNLSAGAVDGASLVHEVWVVEQ